MLGIALTMNHPDADEYNSDAEKCDVETEEVGHLDLTSTVAVHPWKTIVDRSAFGGEYGAFTYGPV